MCITCLLVKTVTVSQIILACLLKLSLFFSSKDNLVDWVCNDSCFDAVHVRIIVNMSIAHDWQGIRYNK